MILGSRSIDLASLVFGVKIGCHDSLFYTFLIVTSVKVVLVKQFTLPFIFKAMHNIEPLIADFKAIMEKIDALTVKYVELCQVEKNVKSTIFYRVKHTVAHVEKQKTQMLQLIRRFVALILQIVGSRAAHTIEGPLITDWLYTFECVDAFNKVRPRKLEHFLCNMYVVKCYATFFVTFVTYKIVR